MRRAIGLLCLLCLPLCAQRIEHVVLINFGGGVRSRETVHGPEITPQLARLAREGSLYLNVEAEGFGHFGAVLALFTGNSGLMGLTDRSESPTLFEYVRKSLALTADDCWLVTGDADFSFLAASAHPDYGEAFAARVFVSPEGASPFAPVLRRFGNPVGPGGAGQKALEALAEHFPQPEGEQPDAPQGFESAAGMRGDLRALSAARRILLQHRPRLLAVVLNDADVAHKSFKEYVKVVQENDSALGQLLDALDADPELAASTAIIVCPEFGRDRSLNRFNGLDHGDGSSDLNRVALHVRGPGIPAGLRVDDPVRTVDLTPTVCAMLGVEIPLDISGKAISLAGQ